MNKARLLALEKKKKNTGFVSLKFRVAFLACIFQTP